jgi:F-type H+-transporting ATPase subunit alpha
VRERFNSDAELSDSDRETILNIARKAVARFQPESEPKSMLEAKTEEKPKSETQTEGKLKPKAQTEDKPKLET